jgi:ubiquinone/menaquinone biosynthesis C-methylase UbiE
MADDRNPQSAQMGDESMVRGLAAQAQAIWPQERELLLQLPLPAAPEVLDLGCGTGEFASRFAELLPRARVLGIEIHAPHVRLAQEHYAELGQRVEFRVGDAFDLDIPDDTFDLAACRHVLQAVPRAELVLAEMKRVTRPGGWLHILVEDYGMLHFHPVGRDTEAFFLRGAITYAERTGTDMRIGRRMVPELARLGLNDIWMDYLTIDTLRVPREVMASIFSAWRDGYAQSLVEVTDLSAAEVQTSFEEILACILSDDGYAVWHVPVLRARVGAA